MKVDLTQRRPCNFDSAGKDLKDIMFKILNNQNLLKLLKHTTPDALDRADVTLEEKKLLINDNIRIVPKLPVPGDRGSYIIILFDNFVTNDTNPEFRDNLIMFDIICHTDLWQMNDYMLRPYKILHELDSMFNKTKLNGIGRVGFVDAQSLVISSELSGFTLMYRVINDVG